YTGTRSSILGHNAGEDTISVGAIPFFGAPPFVSDTTTIVSETFSGAGPVTHVFNADGSRRSSNLALNKPDLSSIDGTNTSFFGGTGDISNDSDSFPNFFGTSAAAPNLAAVIALIKQADPTADQSDVLFVLRTTTHPVNGTPSGTYDPQAGFGLIDAERAIASFIGPPLADIADVSPDPRTAPLDSISIAFNQLVTGFDLDDLTLTRDGGADLLGGVVPPEVGLSAAAVPTLSTTDSVTYALSGISSLTSTNGNYVLTLKSAGTGILNAVNSPLATGATEGWQKISPPPKPIKPTGVIATASASSQIRLTWTDNNPAESAFTLQRSLDANFLTDVKTVQVAPNTSSHVFTSLEVGRRYYFRVRASNLSGISQFSDVVAALTLLRGEVIVDNASSGARLTGSWATRSDSPGFFGTDFLSDENAGKGQKSVRFIPELIAKGPYFIYARWARASELATSVLYDVFSYPPDPDERLTVRVNQRAGGGGWVLLGGFDLDPKVKPYVRIRTSESNGTVFADAIRFLPAAPVTLSAPRTSAATFAAPPKEAGDDSSTNGLDELL
ncbi:MAG: fibronectin type III domain-containing protein, partial [Tepidisphaeraceae bacterium]